MLANLLLLVKNPLVGANQNPVLVPFPLHIKIVGRHPFRLVLLQRRPEVFEAEDILHFVLGRGRGDGLILIHSSGL